jgi:hypothetical protein
MMKRILILLHMGSELRQFGHSGFVDALIEKGWEVLIGSHLPADEWLTEISPAVKSVIVPQSRSRFILEQLAAGLDLAQARLRQKAGLSNWSYGKRNPTRNIRQVLRRGLQAALGILFVNPVLSKWGRRLEARLIRAQGDADFAGFLDEYKPDAIVVNVPRFGGQVFLLSAAQRRGIPRFLFYHTNKDVVALSRLDHQFTGIGVWNEWMKAQVVAQNVHVSAMSVSITGCGHFDCVGRPDWLVPEADFRSSLGIGSGDNLVLYTAAGPGAVPAEERFIESVFRALLGLQGVQARLIVRLNPMDDSPRIEQYLRKEYPQMIVLRPQWHYSRAQNLCFQKKADAIFFNSLLQYSAVCVNIPSTLTTECALVGLPVINIGFDLPGPRPLPGSIRSFWDVDFYANVRRSGSAILCDASSELGAAIHACLRNRNILLEQQGDLIQMELSNIRPPSAHRLYREVVEAGVGG